MLSRTTGLGVALLLFLSGCKKDGGVPSYIQLYPITVSTTTNEGSASNRISDVWAYDTDKLLGVWEAGGRIPVLNSGPTNIKLIAGIRRNGVSSDRVQYPFYDTYETTMGLVPEVTSPLAPEFQYYDGLDFWIENFDGNGFQFDREAASDTVLYVWDTIQHPVSEIFEGRASGAFFLDNDRSFFSYVYDGTPFNLPLTEPVYLEMNYRCDARFLIGAYMTNSGGIVERIPYLYVSPTKLGDGTMPWKKIYIDLQPAWGYGGTSDKKFYIECTLPSGQSTAQV
ncbi:MAG: hypothetical protein IT229_00650 [Flavobacteriales bacterium]|nr:hypothetical protein [Flavobacteriales bacterium]